MDVKEENILGNKIYSHWYYIAKGRAMRKILSNIGEIPEVLDVGAGSGIFSRQLLDAGLCNNAICVDPNYPEEKIEHHNGKPIHFVKTFQGRSQKLILMMDVLEHVPDDLALLKQYVDSLESGGYILITVPAFQFLWSGHDQFLEHYRRYTLNSVESIVKQAGMMPVHSRYFFGILFPVIAAIRLSKKAFSDPSKTKVQSELKCYPDWLNTILIYIHDLERRTLFAFNKFFGLSVFCICRKK